MFDNLNDYNNMLQAQQGARFRAGHGPQPAGLAAYKAKQAAAELRELAPYSVKKDDIYSASPWHVYNDGKALCEFFATKKAAVAWIHEQKNRRETISTDAAPAASVPETDATPEQPAAVVETPAEKNRETILHNEQEEKKMSPVYEFLPAALVVNEKSFPAVYTIDENAVNIAATVQENGAEKIVTIRVPDTDKNYSLVYAVASAAASVPETDAAPEQPAAVVETPAADPAPETDAPAVDVNEQPAAADPDENRRETISTDAAPAASVPETDDAPEQPAAVVETPAADPAPETGAPAVDVNEQPAASVLAQRAPVNKPPRSVAPEKPFAGEKICGQGWTIVFDIALQRTRVIVNETIREKAAPIVENAGFYYSKQTDSWHKKLTFKAQRAAVALADNLRRAIA